MELFDQKHKLTQLPKSGLRNVRLDFLRIVFATLVLLSHAPEIIDGNRSRELFARLTHTQVSFGDFAVDGFFLLSGYLILQSWLRKPELSDYVRKRCLRIIPGYLVAVTISVLVAGFVAPGVPHFFHHLGRPFVQSVLLLNKPVTPPVFPAVPHDRAVNDSLWTIGYEFRCYLLVALLGLSALLRRRYWWFIITGLLLAPFLLHTLETRLEWHRLTWLLGEPDRDMRLLPIFFVGGCFHLFKPEIRFRPFIAAAACVGLVLTANYLPDHFESFLVIFGSYLLFYFGSLGERGFRWMHQVPDISYGTYLYGWPVEMVWISFHKESPWSTFCVSTLICFLLGWLSWHYVERPMIKYKRRSAILKPA